MLPEDAFIRHSGQWHELSGGQTRPEDVILAAFVPLRHIAVRSSMLGGQLLTSCLSLQAETTEIFHDSRQGSGHTDIKYDVVLRNCNGKLTQWMDHWTREMQKGAFYVR